MGECLQIAAAQIAAAVVREGPFLCVFVFFVCFSGAVLEKP